VSGGGRDEHAVTAAQQARLMMRSAAFHKSRLIIDLGESHIIAQ